jgi:hypothetical protein
MEMGWRQRRAGRRRALNRMFLLIISLVDHGSKLGGFQLPFPSSFLPSFSAKKHLAGKESVVNLRAPE